MEQGTPFHLRVEQGPGVGQRFPVAGAGLTIGRQEGNAIVLNDERLSRRHARLDLGPGGLVVTDLGSANGTLVNGLPISGPTPLRPGDVLGLGGNVVLRVEAPAAPALGATQVAVQPPPRPVVIAPARERPATAPPARRAGGRGRLIAGVGAVVALVLAFIVGAVVLAGLGSSDRGAGSSAASTGTGGGRGPARPGFVTGRITDAAGQPLRDAEVRVTVSGLAADGSPASFTPPVDAEGRYAQEVPEGQYGVSATVGLSREGRRFTFPLHPTDNVPPANRAPSGPGIVKDFQWRMSGLRPLGTEGRRGSHYGGTVYLSPGPFTAELAQQFPGGTVEVTLTPAGALFDGSPGRVVTERRGVAEIGSTTQGYLLDIPLGTYTATAKVIGANGAEQPLGLRIVADGRISRDDPYEPQTRVGFPPGESGQNGTDEVLLLLKK